MVLNPMVGHYGWVKNQRDEFEHTGSLTWKFLNGTVEALLSLVHKYLQLFITLFVIYFTTNALIRPSGEVATVGRRTNWKLSCSSHLLLYKSNHNQSGAGPTQGHRTLDSKVTHY